MTCYLIDVSIYFFRFYFSVRNIVPSRDGHDVAATIGWLRWLLNLLDSERPRAIALCFDESLGTCFRNAIDPLYKSNRPQPDDALLYQLSACKQLAQNLGLPVYGSDMFEADDLIASLFRAACEQGLEPLILSRDKDLAQLLRPQAGAIWDYGYGDRENYETVMRRLGLRPEQLVDLLAIVGDSVDAIRGVPGIGAVTARVLLTHFSSWAELKANLDAVPQLPIRAAGKVAARLAEHAGLLDKNIQLTRLRDDALPKNRACFDRVPLLNNSAAAAALTDLFECLRMPPALRDLAIKTCA